MIALTLTCRIDKRCAVQRRSLRSSHAFPPSSESCGPKQEEFLKRCFYTSGQYDAAESFQALSAEIAKHESLRLGARDEAGEHRVRNHRLAVRDAQLGDVDTEH